MSFNYISKLIKEKIASLFSHKKYAAAILAVILLGIFFRAYNFSDWLHFELDQARDANVITDAVAGGSEELPLLGPRARGTYLRLGPLFYYFGYASARVFSPDPPGIATSVLLLSILALPVFYWLFRRYFSRNIALGLLSVACFSLFLILYSRFYWNPNPLVIFVPLALYALLRAVDREEKRKGFWLAASFFSAAAATQLHFAAFIVLPAVFFIFLAAKRPRISFKYWMVSTLIVLFLYSPVFLNEYKTKGDNFKELRKAVSDESEKDILGPKRKLFIDLKEHISGYFLILSGKDDRHIFSVSFERFTDRKTYSPFDYSVSLSSAAFFALALALAFYKFRKETSSSKKDFLGLMMLLFAANLILFFVLAEDLSPRFFLLTAVIPFVFLGLVLEQIPARLKFLAPLVILLLIFSNGLEIKKRFSELSRAWREPVKIENDRILKEKTRVTYFQENIIAEHMVSRQRENGYPIFFSSPDEYDPAFEYILEQKGVLFGSLSEKDVYWEGNYFLIRITREDRPQGLSEYQKSFNMEEERGFGTLTLMELFPREEAVTEERKDFSNIKKKNKSTPKRYKWGELFF